MEIKIKRIEDATEFLDCFEFIVNLLFFFKYMKNTGEYA